VKKIKKKIVKEKRRRILKLKNGEENEKNMCKIQGKKIMQGRLVTKLDLSDPS